jgi:hypothetical protein
MRFDDIDIDSDQDLKERLSSWRRVAGVAGQLPASMGDISINEAEVRQRQHRAGSMILNSVKGHDAFVGALKAFVENGKGERDLHHQTRVEDFAAFALGVFEQFSAGNLNGGLDNEAGGFPKEIIETITIPAPQPPKSWLQRALGI